MRKILSLLCCLVIIMYVEAQVGVGTNSPHPKAALKMKSTDKGVFFPMMTTAQRDDINEPPNGLHVFNTANSIVRFGDRYATGTYFVRIMQGKEHKGIKLIKLPD